MNNGEDNWLGDSAASRHMLYRSDWFTKLYKNNESETTVQIGDASHIEVESYGTIEILALIHGKWEPRTLENVLYVPKLKNLFSIGAATSKNLKVIFNKDRLEIHGTWIVSHRYKTDEPML